MTPTPHARRSGAALALVLAAAGALTGCDADAPPDVSSVGPHPARLAESTWTLVSAQGRPLPGGDNLIWFHDAFLIGSTGCNRFTAKVLYDAPSGAVRVLRPSVTKFACAVRYKLFEQSFLQAMAGAKTASLDFMGRLVLDGVDGPIVLAPTDQPPPTD